MGKEKGEGMGEKEREGVGEEEGEWGGRGGSTDQLSVVAYQQHYQEDSTTGNSIRA